MKNNNISGLLGTEHFLVEFHSDCLSYSEVQEKAAAIQSCLDRMMINSPLLCSEYAGDLIEELEGKLVLCSRCLLQFDQAPNARVKTHVDVSVLRSMLAQHGLVTDSIEHIDSTEQFNEVIAGFEQIWSENPHLVSVDS